MFGQLFGIFFLYFFSLDFLHAAMGEDYWEVCGEVGWIGLEDV